MSHGPEDEVGLPLLPAREGQRRRSRQLALAAAVVVAALLGGGTAAVLTDPSRTPTAAAPPPSPAVATPSAGTTAAPRTPAPSPSPSPAPSPLASPCPAPAVPSLVEVSGDVAFFRTPSGNIGCQLTPTTAACDVLEHSWDLPPRPEDCEFDFGQGAFLDGDRSGLTCASDTPFAPEAPVLEYGTGWLLGAVRCSSTRDGVTCENTATRGGFAVSRRRTGSSDR